MGYKCPHPGKPQPHPLQDGVQDVLKMLVTSTEPHHTALIALQGLCGCRVSEARSVKPIDFMPDQTIRLWGKGDKVRYVPYNDRVWEYLERAYLCAVQNQTTLVPINDRAARAVITRIGRRALGRDVASHDLRMTFGTQAYEKTKDIRAVQELLGHASSTTTEIYTLVSQGAMRKAAELI